MTCFLYVFLKQAYMDSLLTELEHAIRAVHSGQRDTL